MQLDKDNKINSHNNEDEEIEEDEDPNKKKIVGKHDSGAADLAKVTTYEASFFDEEAQNDSSEISGAARSIIDSKRSKEVAEKVARQKELAKVIIRKEDVELIMNEMEISKADAELKLRQAMGNVVQALITLLNE
ncbi:huntingtin-interacting protein K-like protein [Euroglyphus maynei]|uniref:Huntingtin-interacting protein K-like protein n=1 Tax=Euroglyphus maynei TaxID=6958 RepID=A0A1Y3B7Q8_EURMA|nr:huntingtin-interacting protein K-like protein [Euroglyphus maynei]